MNTLDNEQNQASIWQLSGDFNMFNPSLQNDTDIENSEISLREKQSWLKASQAF